MRGCGPVRMAFCPWSRSREDGTPARGCEEAGRSHKVLHEAAVSLGHKKSDFLRLHGPSGSFPQAATLFLFFPEAQEISTLPCLESRAPSLSCVLPPSEGGGPCPSPDTPVSFRGGTFLRSWKEKLHALRETFYPLAKNNMLKYSVHVLNVAQPCRAMSLVVGSH